MMLHEKYRPTTLADVVGNPRAVGAARRLLGQGGVAVWISGPSGTGKTTIARILSATVASPYSVEECDGSDLTVPRLRELAQQQHYYGLGEKPGRAYIVNEAHGMRRDAVRYWLTLAEPIPAHVLWVFTTTWDGHEELFDAYADMPAFLSRCVPIRLTNQGLAPLFAERARTVAMAEHLDGRADVDYLALAKRHRNNLRAMLSDVATGAMAEAVATEYGNAVGTARA